MEFSSAQFEAKIDTAQEISLNFLLGLFSAVIVIISLAFGIASAVLIMAFTALRLAIRYAMQFIASFREQTMRPLGRMEEPIIFTQAYRRRSSSHAPVRRKVRRKVIRSRSLYVSTFA